MNKLLLGKQATGFRSVNGLGSDDPLRLKSLLSKLNVLTLFKPLGEHFAGMAIKVETGSNIARFMLVNASHSKGKQHFTICHELYHLYIQKEFHSMLCNTAIFKKGSGAEYHADVFASHLLLPEHGVKCLIPDHELAKDKISLKTIIKIEQYFSCSRAALLYRLKDLNLITAANYSKFCSNVKRSAIQYGYSTALYEPGGDYQLIGDYGELARDLFDREIISESHYIGLLSDAGISEDKLEKLFNEEES